VATALVAFGLFVFGVVAFIRLPVAAVPDIDYPMIVVEAGLPGASAEVMAATVAEPLERQLASVRGIQSMTSTNFRGYTNINLAFDPSRNMDAAAVEVEQAISAASGDLPADLPSAPGWSRDNPSDWSIFGIAVTSDIQPLTRVDGFAETLISRRATEIPGVRRTIDWARQRPTIKIEANPAALAARGLSLEDLRTAVRAASVEKPKGNFQSGNFATGIATNDQLTAAADYARIIVAWREAGPVRIGDVATVEEGPDDPYRSGWFNGQPAIEFGYRRLADANIVATAEAIKERLPKIEAAMPAGTHIHTAMDRSVSIRAAVGDVEFTLCVTIALVVFVIFAFLHSARAAVIPSIAIPVSLFATALVMWVCGYLLDNLSLMALTISVGFVVDDAIVVIENVARHVESGMAPRQAALEGVKQVGFTILSITLSLVAVFLPVLLMGGVVGRLFREFGVTASAAILISAAVSLFITPMMCARLLRHAPTGRRNRLAVAAEAASDRLSGGYVRSLGWVLRHRGLVLIGFAATLVLTVRLYIETPKGFFPPSDTGRVSGTLISRADLSPRSRIAVEKEIAGIVSADPDVATVMFGDDFTINLKPLAERHASLDAILDRLRKATATVAGTTFYLQPQRELVVGGWSGGHAEYQYTLRDANRPELAAWTPKLEAGLAGLPGLRDVAADQADLGTDIRIDIDRDVAARLGLDMDTIDETIYDAFGRRRISQVFTDAAQIDVMLEVADDFQIDEHALDLIYVKSAGGTLVPVSAFAHVTRVQAPNVVKHKGQMPAMAISFNLLPGVSLGDAVERIHGLEAELGKPATLQTGFEGTAGEFERSLASEPWLIGAAILVIYIVLGMLYESFLHPLTILSTLPSAGIGALLMLTAFGYDLSVIAMIGILLLIGIVKKNAIMMVDFALDAERKGASPEAAIRSACRIRFRPIMMTTCAALVGALPLALGHGPGFELRRPLGLAIVGGLMLSQVLTLYTTPVMYLAFSGLGSRGRAIMAAWRRPRLAPGLAPGED
jgi:hydrophobe/amphiphile efflux-1 (HAE1) family protein